MIKIISLFTIIVVFSMISCGDSSTQSDSLSSSSFSSSCSSSYSSFAGSSGVDPVSSADTGIISPLNPEITYEDFTDPRDGSVYQTVRIGSQVWMAQNLRFEPDTGSYCNFEDPRECSVKGRVYSWDVAMNGDTSSFELPQGVQGICPDGWLVPSDSAWERLLVLVSETTGFRKKYMGDWRWLGKYLLSETYSGGGSDDFGFSGVPGGMYWWSSTKKSDESAWVRIYEPANHYIERRTRPKSEQRNIRCFHPVSASEAIPNDDMPPEVRNIAIEGTARAGETLRASYDYYDANGDAEGMSRYRWLRDSVEIDNASELEYMVQPEDTLSIITFEVTPIASQRDTLSGEPRTKSVFGVGISFVDARDGQRYGKTSIGSQVWMAENLNYKPDSGSYCYNDNPGHCSIYGRLYSWYGAMAGDSSSSAEPSGVQGVCPEGWHLPSSKEWETMVDYIVREQGIGVGVLDNYWNSVAHYLKAKKGWGRDTFYEDKNWNDDYGFRAIPGGYGETHDGYIGLGYYSYWWTSTEYYNNREAFMWSLDYELGGIWLKDRRKDKGMSIRCIQD